MESRAPNSSTSDDDQVDARLVGFESIGQKTERSNDDLPRQCVHAMMVALRSDALDDTAPKPPAPRERGRRGARIGRDHQEALTVGDTRSQRLPSSSRSLPRSSPIVQTRRIVNQKLSAERLVGRDQRHEVDEIPVVRHMPADVRVGPVGARLDAAHVIESRRAKKTSGGGQTVQRYRRRPDGR